MSSTNGWRRVFIADVCELVADCVNRTPPSVDEQTPYMMIRTTNVKDGRVDLSGARYVTRDTYRKWTRRATVRPGDVILTREAPLGQVGMVRCHHRICLGQRLMQYRADPESLDSRFLLYSFMGHDIQSQIMSFGSGATVEHMRVADARQLTIMLPSLEVQRKIGSTLSAYDDLIQNNLRRIAILEEMAQAIYREWFVEFRYPGHASVSIRELGGAAIPEGWRQGTIGEISSYLNRGVSPKYDDSSQSTVINQRCIRHGRLNMAFARTHSTKVPADKYVRFGDILINSTGEGTLGRATQVYTTVPDCTVDSHVTMVRPGEGVNLDYLGLSVIGMQSRLSVSGVGSTGQTELGRDVIANMPVLIPPRMVQDKFSQLVAPMRRQAITLDEMNIILTRTRDLLLPRLISGELDVSNITIDAEEDNL